MKINFSNDKSIYLQIAEEIEDEILNILKYHNLSGKSENPGQWLITNWNDTGDRDLYRST